MVKPELGTKRVCVSCAARFYDLMKVPAVCPKCGTEQPIEQPRIRRGAGNLAEEKRLKKAVPVEDADTEAEETEEAADEEDDTTDSTDALDDDTDAIADEIEIEPEEP